MSALSALDKPVLLLAHPRLVAEARDLGISLNQGNLRQHEPLAYPALLATVMTSSGVITDSGGLQKEAFLLKVPCTTVRAETEWVETLAGGWNVLTLDAKDIAGAVARRRPDNSPAPRSAMGAHRRP